MKSKRKIDANGFMLIEGCPISSFGIFQYSAGQVGLPGDPNRIVNVYRPESAINDPEAIASFQNLPFIDDHEMLSGFQGDDDNTAPEEYGHHGILTGNVYYDAPWLRGDLKVFSRQMQKLFENGKEDLSLGYACKYEIKSGVFEGQAYEVVQTQLRGNHIALVNEGRVPGARVLDGKCFDHMCFTLNQSDKETDEMAPKKAKAKANVKPNRSALDSAVQELQTLLPQVASAFEEFMGEESEEPEHKDDDTNVETETVETENENEDESEETARLHESEGEHNEVDVKALVSGVEEALAKLKKACGMSSGEDEDETESATDKVEGVEGIDENDAGDTSCEDESKNSGKDSDQDPAEMAEKASDAALSRFYNDLAVKDRVYNRVSKVVGAFDSRAMDARQVSAYGLKKLGLKAERGQEVAVLENYLNGMDAGLKRQSQNIKQRAADSAESCRAIDQYLAQGK